MNTMRPIAFWVWLAVSAALIAFWVFLLLDYFTPQSDWSAYFAQERQVRAAVFSWVAGGLIVSVLGKAVAYGLRLKAGRTSKYLP